MKLEKVVKSDAKGKKWTAVFCMCKGESCCAQGDSRSKQTNINTFKKKFNL